MAGRKTPAAFWVCFFILLIPVLGICIYQIADRISFYVSYPVTRESREIAVQSQPFPSVTVCNNNPIRKAALSGTTHASLLDTDEQVRQGVENLLASTSSGAVNPSAAREILNTAYQDRRTARATGDLVGMSRDDIANLGHQLSDFVMSCSYNGRQCVSSDLSSVFTTFQSAKFGNCFTFNANFKVSSPNKGQGLTMTLYTDVAEYVGLFGRQPGVTVTVHPANTTAFPEDDGIVVRAGESAAIGLRKTVNNRMLAPFGDCQQDTDAESLYPGGYSLAACRKECLQKTLLQNCGCLDDPRTTSGNLCTASEESCRSRYYEQGATWRDNCDCKRPCREESYVTAMTSSPWAPENVLIPELDYVTPLPDVGGIIKQNIVQVQVYYLDNTSQQVDERAAYPVNKLMRDIGLDIAVWLALLLILIGIGYLVVLIIRACCGEGGGNKAI
ncbi:PREDICTED: amiloride-sensitive sodium channel subunit alpha-like [Branchiostoma belcheri]|uniref:Amiloride-sensitive sodium channel subunit alpha-like n=1 Tax=Branchiostoma belcheri TaxID=7741 RepID=A0A6P4Y4C7_BRABE|nr:PREDICTED: amiloride-sensitive sodium channel subunit alpha-like [Branchiostoma belcheri]